MTFLRYVISTPSLFFDLSIFRSSSFNIASCELIQNNKVIAIPGQTGGSGWVAGQNGCGSERVD
ncbi:hypothetical protein HanIR_Chr14g0698351 [Helianthus annuus]|nr:hypothetical protein HanIR_Chr14g0698351 [Helianthus annuus]